MLHDVALDALAAAPAFPPDGAWTPLRYAAQARADAAYVIAAAIRAGAHMLTAAERTRFGMELVSRSSCDHAHRPEFEPHDELITTKSRERL